MFSDQLRFTYMCVVCQFLQIICVLSYEIIITQKLEPLNTSHNLGVFSLPQVGTKVKRDDTSITRMIQGKDLGEKKEIMASALQKKIWSLEEVWPL